MYGTLVTDDTYKRADGIYKGITEVFNPNLKEFIIQGKIHDKNLVEEGKSNKACQSVAVKMGIAATVSPGCKDVGKCIMDIADAMQEVNKARDNWLNRYRNDVLYTMERRCEQDGKYVNGLRKKFQEDFKARSNETEKAMAGVMKLNKRSLSKPSSRKLDEKMQKASDKLHVAKTATESIAHEMLSRAFSEERRRYCFFVEKQCEIVQALIEYHESALEVLRPNLDDWLHIGGSHNDLLPGAVALIESTLPQASNPALDDLDTTLHISRSVSSNEFGKKYDSSTDTTYDPSISAGMSSALRGKSRKNFSSKSTSDVKEINAYNNPYRAVSGISISSNDIESPDVIDGAVFRDDEITDEIQNTFKGRSPEFGSYRVTSRSDEEFVSNIIRRGAREGGSALKGNNMSLSEGRSLNDSAIDVNWNSEIEESDALKQQERRALSPLSLRSHESQKSPSSSRSSTISDSSEVWYVSFYDYTPEANSNKLALIRGDKIKIHSGETKGGWIYGENIRTRQRGWFPQNYGEKKYKSSNQIPPTISSSKEESHTPPNSPAFNLEMSKGLSSSASLTNRYSFEAGSPQGTDRPKSTHSANGKSSMDGKKRLSGKNVFQFATDLEKPFSEIRLRKTDREPLH